MRLHSPAASFLGCIATGLPYTRRYIAPMTNLVFSADNLASKPDSCQPHHDHQSLFAKYANLPFSIQGVVTQQQSPVANLTSWHCHPPCGSARHFSAVVPRSRDGALIMDSSSRSRIRDTEKPVQGLGAARDDARRQVQRGVTHASNSILTQGEKSVLTYGLSFWCLHQGVYVKAATLER